MLRTTFPVSLVRLASDWHGGQSSTLYAVSSTGGLNPGSIRPYNHDESRPCTDGEWHVGLFDDLESELRACIRTVNPDSVSHKNLSMFLHKAENARACLSVRYGLEPEPQYDPADKGDADYDAWLRSYEKY